MNDEIGAAIVAVLGRMQEAIVNGAPPLELNEIAFHAGTLEIAAKERKSVLEGDRKALQFKIRDELMAADPALKRTPAEDAAKTDARYTRHVADGEYWLLMSERAGLVREIALQRAAIAFEIYEIRRATTDTMFQTDKEV